MPAIPPKPDRGVITKELCKIIDNETVDPATALTYTGDIWINASNTLKKIATQIKPLALPEARAVLVSTIRYAQSWRTD
jgi:hypothetical protein